MVSQANSEASSSRSQSVHFTPSTTHVFGASSSPASRRLSEIRQFRGASTQPGSEPTRPARPRFFSSPGREDNSHPSPQYSRRPRSQLSSSVRPTFSTRASPEKSFQAETSFYTPCPPSRRRESVSWKRPQTSEPRAGGLFDNLPSRPAPKRRNLFGTSSSSGSMGDSTPTSQQGTGSQTPPTPASLSRSSYSYSFQPSRASSRTLSPEKRESPAPSRSATVVETPKCYIDPDGDLCLEVGFVAAKFVVDSKILARASPAWKKLLDTEGKKLEQTRGGGKLERVLKLPDDNNSAMEIFLNIVHGRFDRVSGYDEFVYCVYFYSLCVLTHKYDMTRILRPWAKGWSRTVHANCDKLGDSLRTKFCHERLWIAWELGDQATFEEIAKTLLLESSSEPGYNLKYVGAVEPPEIYGKCSSLRFFIRGRKLTKLDCRQHKRNPAIHHRLAPQRRAPDHRRPDPEQRLTS